MDDKKETLDLTTDIVAAYVGHNKVDSADLPDLIKSVFGSLHGLLHGEELVNKPPLTPAVPVEDSITDDYLICLEDGKSYKSLKRHLRTQYDLSPQAYREKWGLPHDYPMVAPNYAKARSQLAKKMGLGRGQGD